MLKEAKYLLFVFVIFVFFFLSIKYYTSDDYKKNYFRNLTEQDKFIKNLTNDLPILDTNTDNIIEYVDNNKNKSKKKFKFWELLINDK
tara:strand:- start:164 stop:427 length:264 start_codon:yes stop_codon:yes gene_type:complete